MLELRINTQDPEGNGSLQSYTSEIPATPQVFFRGDTKLIGILPVAPTGNASAPWRNDYNATDTIRVTVGNPDVAPTSGTTTLEYGGEEFVMTAGMSESAADAAIGGATSTAADEATTTTKEGEADYVVVFQSLGAPSSSFTVTGNDLRPTSDVIVKKIVAGDADTREVWRITVAQKGLASATPSTAYPTLASPVVAVATVAGSPSNYSAQSLTFDPPPIGGTAIWGAVLKQLTDITISADDVAGSLNTKVIGILYDGSGQVQMYLFTGVGSPPAAPSGGRNHSITYAEDESAATIAARVYTEMLTDSDVVSIALDGTTITFATGIAGAIPGGAEFPLTIQRLPQTINATLPWNASTSDIETALGGLFTVQSAATTGVYALTATEFGAQQLVGVDTTGLVVPQGFKGSLVFDSLATIQAFADTTADFIERKLEVERTPSGGSPETIYRDVCKVFRDNQRTA